MDAGTLSNYRIAHVVGARPQFVKLKPLVAAIQRLGGMNWVAHTGQHYDPEMNESFWEVLGFRPDYHGKWIEREIDQKKLQGALKIANVDAVIVYGDTDSTVLGARAAKSLGIPCAHAEAGLRSFNDAMPEERNRVWVDQHSLWLWGPTKVALSHLRNEGLDRGKPWVVCTGDLMYDAFPKRLDISIQPRTILVTLHRNTNVDNIERLRRIEDALDDLAHDFDVVWPRHPRHRAVGLQSRIVEDRTPMSRSEIIESLYKAEFVVTDSGGLQKEAFFAQRRAIVLREETEWTELVESGWTSLVSPDSSNLAEVIRNHFAMWSSIKTVNPPQLYGNGHAADVMARSLAEGLVKLRAS